MCAVFLNSASQIPPCKSTRVWSSVAHKTHGDFGPWIQLPTAIIESVLNSNIKAGNISETSQSCAYSGQCASLQSVHRITWYPQGDVWPEHKWRLPNNLNIESLEIEMRKAWISSIYLGLLHEAWLEPPQCTYWKKWKRGTAKVQRKATWGEAKIAVNTADDNCKMAVKISTCSIGKNNISQLRSGSWRWCASDDLCISLSFITRAARRCWLTCWDPLGIGLHRWVYLWKIFAMLPIH